MTQQRQSFNRSINVTLCSSLSFVLVSVSVSVSLLFSSIQSNLLKIIRKIMEVGSKETMAYSVSLRHYSPEKSNRRVLIGWLPVGHDVIASRVWRWNEGNVIFVIVGGMIVLC